MNVTEIVNPVFKMFSDQNRHGISRATRNACREGWFPVGEMSQRGREWVQVMMIEGRVEKVDDAPRGTYFKAPNQIPGQLKEVQAEAVAAAPKTKGRKRTLKPKPAWLKKRAQDCGQMAGGM